MHPLWSSTKRCRSFCIHRNRSALFSASALASMTSANILPRCLKHRYSLSAVFRTRWRYSRFASRCGNARTRARTSASRCSSISATMVRSIGSFASLTRATLALSSTVRRGNGSPVAGSTVAATYETKPLFSPPGDRAPVGASPSASGVLRQSAAATSARGEMTSIGAPRACSSLLRCALALGDPPGGALWCGVSAGPPTTSAPAPSPPDA
mmetsp:Transcript_33570/g.103632  ORF Transcript_33570/g.103632 Transcript_33570/m.103632 type:complete len:211 (+) Transcript_33570:1140-1772(+)